jgi:hypothetical protein
MNTGPIGKHSVLDFQDIAAFKFARKVIDAHDIVFLKLATDLEPRSVGSRLPGFATMRSTPYRVALSTS